MTLHPKERMQALIAARQSEETEEYKQVYRHRAGTLWNPFARSAHAGLTPFSLYWSCQNTSGPCGACRRCQSHSTGELIEEEKPLNRPALRPLSASCSKRPEEKF
jgi:hypothetical protein